METGQTNAFIKEIRAIKSSPAYDKKDPQTRAKIRALEQRRLILSSLVQALLHKGYAITISGVTTRACLNDCKDYKMIMAALGSATEELLIATHENQQGIWFALDHARQGFAVIHEFLRVPDARQIYRKTVAPLVRRLRAET